MSSRYGLRRQPAGQFPVGEDADDGKVHHEDGSLQASNKLYEEGAGVYDHRIVEEVPNQNQNQNQVFSLENEADEFLDEEPFKSYEERLAEQEGEKIDSEVSQATSSIGEWIQHAWSTLMFIIGSVFSSISEVGKTVWRTRLYRYALLGILLLVILYYLYPFTNTIQVPAGLRPEGALREDHLPLNVEIFVKHLVEQQLARKQDDILSRVMQKMAADKEELKRKSKEELLQYLDDKINKMDTMIRSRLNAPSDDTLSQELKDLEARVTAELQRLARDIKAGKDVSDEEKRQVRSQLATLQSRMGEIAARKPESGTVSDATERTLSELKALQKALDGLIEAQKNLERRLDNEAGHADARLQELTAQFVSSEVLKAEIARINAALQQSTKAVPGEEDITNSVLTKVLARWNSEKESILRDLQQQIEQARAAIGKPTLPETIPSADEIVASQKDAITAWIKDTVSHELKEVDADISSLRKRLEEHVKLPSASEIVDDAREVIHRWIAEQNAILTPKLVTAAQEKIVPELNQRISEGEKQAFDAIDSQRRQLEALEKRQNVLDASLAAATKEKATATLTDEQLREVVRLLNANRVVGGPSLDEDHVKELIREELELFAADRVNMSDWALGAAGARIIHAHTSDRYGSSLFGYLLGQVGEPPSALLTPSLTLGHCWAFAGEHGNATIQLPRRIRPTAFSLDHVARGVARDFSSAPQNFKVWGYGDKADLADDSKAVLLGDFRYDIYGPEVQTFQLQQPDENVPAQPAFSVIKLGVYSNYGHEDYTCVYRFRVHGEVAL